MSLKQENKIRHLSIEGFDGVGKTTICQQLSLLLNLKFVTKPFHLITDSQDQFENYLHIRNQINQFHNDYSTWFYCLSYGYLYLLDTDVVTDRFLGSNYAWGGNIYNLDIFELAIKKFGKPDLTIILYASDNVLYQRLTTRNVHDKNLAIINHSENYYQKLKFFFDHFHFRYVTIDTTNKNIDEIIKEIILWWEKISPI